MKQLITDLWDVQADVTVITTNGFVKKDGTAVMGRGSAAEAARRWPDIRARVGRHLREKGNHVAYLGAATFDDHEYQLVTMPVKHNWWDAADLALIVQSARELVALTDSFGWTSVVTGRPGCGNGRLDWAQVGPVLEAIWDDRFTVVTWKKEDCP